MPARRLAGSTLRDPFGVRLARIADVVVHPPSARIAYAIVQFGGLLGFGRQYRAVPYDLLSYDATRGAYVLGVTSGELTLAPVLRFKDLAGWTDAEAREQLLGYWSLLGAKPYWS